jgi:hypothetical protein
MELKGIENGEWDTNAHSMNSMNQGHGWDARATLGRGEELGRVETLNHESLAHGSLLRATIQWANKWASWFC